MNGQTVILRTDQQRELAKRLIDRAPPNAVLNIKEAKRSNDQNAKWHAMVSDVARAKPEGRNHPIVVWKALLMAEADFKPIFERSLDGLGVTPVGYKSSRLSKAEFSDLIEATYAYGSKHGVVWSDPRNEEGSSMSMRTLIELNHDYSDNLISPDFIGFLAQYLRSGARADAERLERYGARVVGMRHHADKFVIAGDADGFPPQYLPKSRP